MAKKLSNIVLTNNNITKNVIGLSHIDNTSDLEKPLSTAMQLALSSKQPVLVSGTSIKSINNVSLVGGGNVTIGGDATAVASGSTLTLSLSPSGVIAGTYNQVTVDIKGRVVSAINTVQVSAARAMTMNIIFGS
jgi:hypothetical protein